MSATYQQVSKIPEKLLSIDPSNRLLARGSRFRLSAEAIRDQALRVSGLWVKTIGGKSVRPYQPPGLWKDVVYSNVPKFQQDHGDDLYRRSLYTYWKRSVPPPNMLALDAPSREACTLRRSRTNTPQGALVLWNDPTFVEAARMLAEKIVRQDLDSLQSIRRMFKIVVSRDPTATELEHLKKSHAFFEKYFGQHRQQAIELLETGEFPADVNLNPAKVAPLAAIANAILSLDEAVTRN
ncbi:MAG: DUF1553 domain-containing protein, partial [Planctomycetota bacterium]|nr:DUF1553 domain-containing protein [Planctomycetota bacterium]